MGPANILNAAYRADHSEAFSPTASSAIFQGHRNLSGQMLSAHPNPPWRRHARHPHLIDMWVIARFQDIAQCASITYMIRHYVARRAKVILITHVMPLRVHSRQSPSTRWSPRSTSSISDVGR
jgi:hypothetical protein